MGWVRLTILAACACGLALTAVAEQRSMESYKSIVDRNPFGLKDPPIVDPIKTNPPPPTVKKDDFYLTGISTMGDPKRPKAYLLNKDATKKEYDQKYYKLSVGDKQGDLAVKEIDPKGRRVLIAYLGEDRWLNMKDNAVPAAAGPMPGQGVPMPLVPGAPGAIPPPPGAIPTPLPNAAPVAQPQPLSYPNPNPNSGRRTPRATYSATPSGVPTVTPIVNPAAGTAAAQYPARLDALPSNVPPPPVPPGF